MLQFAGLVITWCVISTAVGKEEEDDGLGGGAVDVAAVLPIVSQC